MTTDASPDSAAEPPAAEVPDRTGYLDAESQRKMRDCVIQLAFQGDTARFDEFVRVLSDATPPGVEVILRGSSIMGHKWHHPEEPFDHDGPGTSDLDVTFVGGNMIMLFHEYHIPGIHSVPLSDEHPFASSALGAIFGLVGLEIIGLGPGGVIDLGQIIFNAIGTGALTLGAWPMFVVPIALLTLLFAALNMVNIGLEEVYNPRLRGVAGE